MSEWVNGRREGWLNEVLNTNSSFKQFCVLVFSGALEFLALLLGSCSVSLPKLIYPLTLPGLSKVLRGSVTPMKRNVLLRQCWENDRSRDQEHAWPQRLAYAFFCDLGCAIRSFSCFCSQGATRSPTHSLLFWTPPPSLCLYLLAPIPIPRKKPFLPKRLYTFPSACCHLSCSLANLLRVINIPGFFVGFAPMLPSLWNLYWAPWRG